MSELEDRVGRIRAGERVRGDVGVFVDGKKLRPEAKELFARELASAPDEERERLVKAVATLGQMNDPLYRLGAVLLRDPDAIELLVKGALVKPGTARDAAVDALHAGAPAELLKPHAEMIVNDLRENPESGALLLTAKAKPPEAKPIVDKLVEGGRGNEEPVQIARAALGDAQVEGALIARFVETENPREKAHGAIVLGNVGTKAALEALASEMRSPLIDEMPMVMQRSVRIEIVGALSFVFPDKPFLWDNAVVSDESYETIEKFCEATFGTTWKSERPPFLWIQGFPGH